MNEPDQLAKRFESITSKIGDATLVAVTKYSDLREISLAYDIGHRDFGENRVGDLETKANGLQLDERDDVRWHFIGHLQTNKVAKLVKIPNLYAIHSIDSYKLLQELLRRESDMLSPVRIYFQVNTSGEAEKGGFEDYESLKKSVSHFYKASPSAIIFEGLMTMGTYRTDDRDGEARRCFQTLKDYAERLKVDFKLDKICLSMGMSEDFDIALEEGADVVRVGSLLFK
ncbi:MAG: YggS family pyridoxal phosphate-dependent enzyme [Halobacteriovorax sp.]|nr:YggS family pyridoxal phosphate-dependent enzyme [Halobacteriovorax sp.]